MKWLPLDRSARTPWVAGLALLLLVPAVHAEILNITLNPTGQLIFSDNGSLSYNAATGNFHSESVAATYTPAPAPGGFAVFSGMATVTEDLFVDKNGKFVSNGIGLRVTGSLDLDGDGIIDVSGNNAHPLLFGEITNFGADAPGPPTRTFNGLFTIQGGTLTGVIPLSGGGTAKGFPVGATNGGFFLFAESVTSGILGNFQADFSSDRVKDQEGLVLPEPSAWILASVGAAGLLLRPRTRARRVSWT
jgi:hypothetical protein